MRHLKAHRKLGRTTEHRMSMLRNLATSLINARDERIITTLPKAKELRPFIERAVTLSRRARAIEGDDAAAQRVHLRRQAAGFFHAGNRGAAVTNIKRGTTARSPRTSGVAALKRLFDELGERYAGRPGGYTRIIKLGRRDGDNAELAIIEFVDSVREQRAASKESKTGAAGKKKTARAGGSKEAAGGRRGGRKADKTYEKPETTRKRGKASDEQTDEPKKGRRAKKTESTAAEKDTND
ncbi:MAG: 50S ribosomal protein L17 [Pyrinomonadaceae bacterium]|nr:50S ribosomal protein L17 [Pyrinomonadaceae bacterium]